MSKMCSLVKTYGIDLDGVCFDFKGGFLPWLNKHLHCFLRDIEITSYYWHENSDDITEKAFWEEFHKFGKAGGYRYLKLLPGVQEALEIIHASGAKIYYITNRPEYACQDTIDALEEHGFPQRENLLFAAGSKAPLVKSLSIDAFIDDSPTTIPDLATNTRAQVYCRNWKFNESLDDNDGKWFRRVDGWDEFLEAEGF